MLCTCCLAPPTRPLPCPRRLGGSMAWRRAFIFSWPSGLPGSRGAATTSGAMNPEELLLVWESPISMELKYEVSTHKKTKWIAFPAYSDSGWSDKLPVQFSYDKNDVVRATLADSESFSCPEGVIVSREAYLSISQLDNSDSILSCANNKVTSPHANMEESFVKFNSTSALVISLSIR